jgi:hypothetical protein
MRYMTFHVWCGRVFLLTGTFVGCSALYMGLHPRLGGIVYGFGLFLNGLFWLAAASIAYYAIRLGNVQVPKDWMIRTYGSGEPLHQGRALPEIELIDRTHCNVPAGVYSAAIGEQEHRQRRSS